MSYTMQNITAAYRIGRFIKPYLQSGDPDTAATVLEEILKKLPTNHFAPLLKAHFTNPPKRVLDHINEFADYYQDVFNIKAIYLEMNLFDINTDEWFFDIFAFPFCKEDSEDKEYYWLAEFETHEWPLFTLQGLEHIQDLYVQFWARALNKDKNYDLEMQIASMLVIARFLQLIRAALNAGNLIVPATLLASAHENENLMMGRFPPRE